VTGRRPLRTCLILLLATAWILPAAEAAFADVDPPSDVLLLQDVYRPYGAPYGPSMCKELSSALDTLTKETKKAGYPLKVAIIAHKVDLGGVPELFSRPQDYAGFLEQELVRFGPDFGKASRNYPLLVVMPAGFGLAQAERSGEEAIKGITVPPKADTNQLARAAVEAIPKLAKAAGHPVPSPKLGSTCSSSKSSTSPLVFTAPILALLLIMGVLALRRRLRLRPSER
jgi:hypothetical protein